MPREEHRMPRRPKTASIDALVREAMEDVVRRASEDIARAIAELAAAELTSRLEAGVPRPAQGGSRGRAQRRPPRGAMTRWVADRRARRVPTFVIELTGLRTKKQIVARYGEDVAFEKGKPAPRPKA
jgi:hypothetical protein